MAQELEAETQRAAHLQQRFDNLQHAAAGSAAALQSFEQRLVEQHQEMEGAALVSPGPTRREESLKHREPGIPSVTACLPFLL